MNVFLELFFLTETCTYAHTLHTHTFAEAVHKPKYTVTAMSVYSSLHKLALNIQSVRHMQAVTIRTGGMQNASM